MRDVVRSGMLLALLTGAGFSSAWADDALLSETAFAFLRSTCFDCHDDLTAEGGLDLSSLPFDLEDPALHAKWVRIHDRVRDGEMPPKRVPEPEARDAFLTAIAAPMVVADQARAETHGRATLRRLNRYEYENALRALFHAPWLRFRDMLPEDGEAHRFNKVGTALDISHVQMARYLDAAEAAMRQVLAASEAESSTTRYYAREQPTFIRRMTYSPFNRSPERTTTPLLGHTAQPEVISEKMPVTVGAANPEIREQEAFGVVNGNYVGNQFHFDAFTAKVGGRYTLRFKAYSYWAGPGEGDRWWKPDRDAASRGRRPEPVTIYAYTPPSEMRRLGSFDAAPDPDVYTMEVYLVPGESIKPDAARLFRSRPGWKGNPLATREGMPGLAYAWMQVEGPLPPKDPAYARRLLFGDLPLGFDANSALEVTPSDAAADAARLMEAFLDRAYRRTPAPQEIHRFVALVLSALEDGFAFAEAMFAGYAAVLCSPAFVFLEEPPGPLDDRALAHRLSFFLWNAPPDQALMERANAKLLQPCAAQEAEAPRNVLRSETDRLLDDPRCGQFVDAFLDYWLDLRKLNATTPDSTLYPDYYLDDLLTESATLETQLYFRELLRKDLPVRHLIASNFTFLNERLAALYGVPGVEGVAMRRVSLPDGSPRGGILTQASVLKVTANGTTTSPVLRGAWVLERILGEVPPPPPPGVGAIEPDTRGAVTIREQLDKHRAVPSCAGCHVKIDPPGFALEHFDVIGGWRDQYRALGDAPPVEGLGKNGHPYAFHLAQAVDASSVLADGRTFGDIFEFKRLLLEDDRQIARNLVQQMVVYATGAAVRFGDRAGVEQILDQTAAGGYGVRSLIHAIVQSELFQRK